MDDSASSSDAATISDSEPVSDAATMSDAEPKSDAATVSNSPNPSTALPVQLEPGQTLLAYLKDRISEPVATATKPSLTESLRDPAFKGGGFDSDDRVYALDWAEVLLWRAYDAYRKTEREVEARLGAACLKMIRDDIGGRDLSSVDTNGGKPLTRWVPIRWKAFLARLTEVMKERKEVEERRRKLVGEAEAMEGGVSLN